jgi:hypothetical protein
VNDPNQTFLPNRTEAYDIWFNYAGLNLRDQIRKGLDVPLQFSYESADCRIFFTLDTYTALWQYAADAIWNKPSLCVKDSTNHSSANSTALSGPTPLAVPSPTTVVPQPSSFAETIMKLSFGPPPAPHSGPITACNGQCAAVSRSVDGGRCDIHNQCIAGYFCLTTYKTCSTDHANPGFVTVPHCSLECDLNAQSDCQHNAVCQAFNPRARNELNALDQDDGAESKLETTIATLQSQLNTRPPPTGTTAAKHQQQLYANKKVLKQLQGTAPGYCHPAPKYQVCG